MVIERKDIGMKEFKAKLRNTEGDTKIITILTISTVTAVRKMLVKQYPDHEIAHVWIEG